MSFLPFLLTFPKTFTSHNILFFLPSSHTFILSYFLLSFLSSFLPYCLLFFCILPYLDYTFSPFLLFFIPSFFLSFLLIFLPFLLPTFLPTFLLPPLPYYLLLFLAFNLKICR